MKANNPIRKLPIFPRESQTSDGAGIYLNAVSILTCGKIESLQKIHDVFKGDFERAWNSDLTVYLQKGRDWKKEREKLSPQKEFEKLEKDGVKTITINDREYPEPLKQISRPPFLLYVKGDIRALSSDCFGIVGTRMMSSYGKQITPKIAGELAYAGFTIVSGMAKGVDTEAHLAAVEANKPTVAVLGHGLNSDIYPHKRRLAQSILDKGGAIISEYSYNQSASDFSYPQRNRIISGLSRGVLVVEADIQSGALITAKFAVEQNRDLFCVPGSIFSPVSTGTHFYIQKGAKLATCAKDILTEYEISYTNDARVIEPSNEIEAKILTILTHEPTHADDIIRQSGYDASIIQTTLMMMELADKIKNLGNGNYVSVV